MTAKPLDVVVLEHDVPARGFVVATSRGVESYGPDSLAYEFVAASGRTQTLVTLESSDVRAVSDRDLVSVRPGA